jgi:membrane protein DedA with SNARE-associated domain
VLTEKISSLAIQCLDSTGYYGAAFLMALESMIAPVPSEAVMPFVGFLVADGKWSLSAAVFATSLGSIIGSLISYFMGAYGGKPLVLRVGRYLLLDEHDLVITERFFNRRSGVLAVFVSRFIPVVRHLISIPAGVGRMPLIPFILVTAVGATLWNSFLLYCGMVLREHWTSVQRYSHQVDVVVVLVIMAGTAWFFRGRLVKRQVATSPLAAPLAEGPEVCKEPAGPNQ